VTDGTWKSEKETECKCVCTYVCVCVCVCVCADIVQAYLMKIFRLSFFVSKRPHFFLLIAVLVCDATSKLRLFSGGMGGDTWQRQEKGSRRGKKEKKVVP